MTREHAEEISEQVQRLAEKIDYNNKITEGLVHQVSGLGSDLKDLKNKVDADREEMKPWLEAKIGLNLIWRWVVGLPAVLVGIYALKQIIGSLNLPK